MKDQKLDYKELLSKALITAKKNQKKIRELEAEKHEPIAIVGVSCKLPGKVENLEDLHHLLEQGKDVISKVPKDRWDNNSYFHPDLLMPGKIRSNEAGFIEDPYSFDAKFFRISPAEASLIDPQQRVILELAWQAIEHANIQPESLFNQKVGTFIGVSNGDYLNEICKKIKEEDINGHLATGNTYSTLAGRISYYFGFKGPCLVIDTACSSSLSAIHTACQSLRKRECNLALAGGVNLLLSPLSTIAFSQAGMLSPDSRCYTFDESANGYVRSEGASIIVLKRLSDALKDKDQIIAKIIGSAINHNGPSGGLTIPNGVSQQDVINQALSNAQITPECVDYLEAHGTGTPLGDPIEINALSQVFSQTKTVKNPLLIGSIKTNLGHTEAAAGVVSVLKVILQLKKKQFYPHLHLNQLNTKIKWESIPLDVVKQNLPWESKNKKRIAGVSSFGLNGSNAHVLLQEYEEKDSEAKEMLTEEIALKEFLIPFSALDTTSLRSYLEVFHEYLEKNIKGISLLNLAYTLQTSRSTMKERIMFIIKDIHQLKKKIKQYLESNQVKGCFHGRAKEITFNKKNIKEEKNNLEKLSKDWINGSNYNWDSLYAASKPKKIKLPNYPFSRQKFTLSKFNKFRNITKHPILHKNISDLREHKFLSILTGKESFLVDHQINNERLLPKVAYIEFAREAGARSLHQPIQQIKDFTWIQPIKVRQQPIQVQINLKENKDDISFYIKSHAENQEIQYASGKLNVIPTKVPKRVDLAILKNRLTNQISGNECYELFDKMGLELGHSLRGIKKLFYSKNEALSKIILPIQQAFVLQPGILYSALQTCLGLHLEEDEKDIYSPFHIKEINIHSSLEKVCWSYAKKDDSQETLTTSVDYDIFLLAENGEVLLSLVGVSFLPVKEKKIVQQKENFDKQEIENQLITILSNALYVDISDIDKDDKFVDLGIDSIIGVEFIKSVNEYFKINLEAIDLYNHSTLRLLSELVIDRFKPEKVHEQTSNNTKRTDTSVKNLILKENFIKLDSLNINPKEKPINIKSNLNNNSDIAIIGISGRFPQSKNLEQFWKHLKNGDNLITEIPLEKWNNDAYFSSDVSAIGKTYSKWIGSLSGVDKFDPLFFNISPKEAKFMDPQHRLVLEESWNAIENAGYAPNSLSNFNCGVFMGVGTGDYLQESIGNWDDLNAAYCLTGTAASILSARISYLLNLKGPALSIDTACSSSLVAIAQACDSLILGNTDMALAGGVCVLNTPKLHISTSKAFMLSEDGKCHTFDQKANGFVPGEGVGVIVLKRLEEAKKDKDQIYGIIKGWGINQDGSSNGITAPNEQAQSSLQTKVYDKFKINPRSISYVEAHGTGTKLGDPIEIKALKNSFNQFTENTNFCGLGSVKSNIGHSLPAAGIAGVLKVVLQLKNRQLAPSINFDQLNTHIDLTNSPFYINDRLKEWNTNNNQPRRAAINSFGFSGTNAHIIIEENVLPEFPELPINQSSHPAIIVLSAHDKKALQTKVQDLYNFLKVKENISLENLAYTLQIGRNAMNERLGIVVNNLEELIQQLENYSEGRVKKFFFGNITEQKNNILLNGEAGKAFMLQALKHKKLESIAHAWVNGVELVWAMLYNETNFPYKISLPTYPFQRKRYWLDNKNNSLQVLTTTPQKRNLLPIENLSVMNAESIPIAPKIENKSLIKLDPLNQVSSNPIQVKEKQEAPLLSKERKTALPLSLDTESSIRDRISRLLQKTLYIEDAILPNKQLTDYGMDSITGVEFVKEINLEFNLNLLSTELYEYPTVNQLATYLSTKSISSQPDLLEKKTVRLEKNNLPLKKVMIKENTIESNHHIPNHTKPNQENKLKEDYAIIAAAGKFCGFQTMQDLWTEIEQQGTNKSSFESSNNSILSDKKLTSSIPPLSLSSVGIEPSDFSELSSQEKLIFEVLSEAITEYGITKDELSAKSTGVFISARQLYDFQENTNHKSLAYLIPNKISYFLNLKGPSEIVSTYCTSAYVAINRAIQSIALGECQQAIVGGINLILKREMDIVQNTPFNDLIASDGQTRSFCDTASGFSRSEGAGILVLKPLSLAKKENNQILGVIKSCIVHHGGKGYSLTAPNPNGIRRVIEESLKKSRIDADTIDYVEAHGIANRVADAIELNAIDSVLKKHSKNPLKKWHIGSIKPIIGHSEFASGIASILKILMAFKNKTLPGVVGLETINSDLFPDHSLILNRYNSSWKKNQHPRRASINGYAVGGLNTHIILEEYVQNSVKTEPPTSQQYFLQQKYENKTQKNKIHSTKIFSELTAIACTVFNIEATALNLNLSLIDYEFDSLKAMQFIRKANKHFDVEIKLGQVLSAQNLEAVYQLYETAISTINRNEIYNSAVIENKYPLTEAQKGLWFIQNLEPDNTLYNLPLALSLETNISPDEIYDIGDRLIEKHPILRVVFKINDETGGLFQQVLPVRNFLKKDIHTLKENQNINQVFQELLVRPFDLSQNGIRFHIRIDQTTNKIFLLFVVHHIIFDGTSGVLLLKEFLHLFEQYVQGIPFSNLQIRNDFFDYIKWEKNYIQSQQGKEDLTFWKKKILGNIERIKLPYDIIPTSNNQDIFKTGLEKFELEGQFLADLKLAAKSLNINLSVLCLAAFKVFLYKITETEKIIVTLPVAGRPKEKHEKSIGYYVNNMISLSKITPEIRFSEFAKILWKNFTTSINHINYPFSKLISELDGVDTEAIKLVSFYFQNFFAETLEEVNTEEIQILKKVQQQATNDYTLEILNYKDSLTFQFKYSKNRFLSTTIKRHLKHYENILRTIVLDSQLLIRDIKIISKDEEKLMLFDFNNTTVKYPKATYIHQVFEAQAKKFPTKIALITEEDHITYEQLNSRANQVANFLQKQKVAKGDFVGICMERSIEMVVSILAVLKVGGTYVPIDPNYPKKRIKYIIQDSLILGNPNTKTPILLTQKHLLANIPKSAAAKICPLKRKWKKNTKITKFKTTFPSEVSSHDIAYLIYTSGSTGQPKGVLGTHGATMNRLHWSWDKFPYKNKEVASMKTTISFVDHVCEIFSPLLKGIPNVIIKHEDILYIPRLLTLLKQHKITRITLVPSLLKAVLEEIKISKLEKEIIVRYWFSSGSVLLPALAQQFYDIFPNNHLINLYGSSEVAADVTYLEVPNDTSMISIGRPISNTFIYILNEQNKLQPLGVKGELCVAGAGVAKGYLNQPNLSKEKFIPNLFGDGKLYKTGDLARWLPDGNIQYLGRKDHQVKILGHRIELGEIEHAINQLEIIQQVVVVTKIQQNTKHLVAYYLLKDKHQTIDSLTLKSQLLSRIPRFMIPNYFIPLDCFPLSPNGKINRKSLQSKKVIISTNEPVIVPRFKTEEKLTEIWKKELGLDYIGIHDNFFELGGSSLTAGKLTAEIVRKVSNITIKTLVKNPTISSLAKVIDQNVELEKVP